jgi:hypothetical protein
MSWVSSSTHKKVIVRRMDSDPVRGWVNPQAYLVDTGVEMLSLDGQVTVLPFEQVKAVHFVRDFEEKSAHQERKVFASRPKLEGLWLRLRFKDAEVIEGILANNLLLVENAGFMITPPDPYANSQRIFVPRSALIELTVLGVIGSAAAPLRKKKAPEAPVQQGQLFE